MSKILGVFGATGKQGKSVIDFVLQDPELSKEYKIRAITRDVNSAAATQLKEKVDVVAGDVLKPASLETALTGVHTVFAMTIPTFGPNGIDTEFNTGKSIADAAVEKGVKYIIFSTLPSIKAISGGKYTTAVHFEAKVKIEEYIRSLSIKSAFVSLGFFMSNFHNMPFVAPQKAADGNWVIARFNAPDSKMPMIDDAADTGNFVGAILAEPDKYEGQTFCASAAQYSMKEVTAAMSKATGKTVTYKQISLEDWVKTLPFGQDIFPPAFSYSGEFGYYGPESEKLVAWAAEHARVRPRTIEQYLVANPLELA